MKQKGISTVLIIVLLVALLIAAVVGATYYLTSQKYEGTSQAIPSPVPTTAFVPSPTVMPTVLAQPTEVEEASSVPAGWLTYENQEYGFTISYPPNYQALDDSENLYGWPKAIVLIYGGGQSYDLPIEVWDTATEYQAKYTAQLSSLTVKQVGGKYITLLNMNNEPEVDQIIATFTTTE